MCKLTGNFYTIYFFVGVTPNFELRNLGKIKYTTEMVCQRNSSINKIKWNFVVYEDILCRCANLQWILIWFFSERTIRTSTKIYYCNLCETGLAWITEKLFNHISCSNVTQMWQLFIVYVYPIITASWL